MTKVEKVVKCLEACAMSEDCAGHTCPYWDYDGDVGCRTQMELDALALLKEQQSQIEALRQTCQNMMEGLVVFRG